MSDTAKDQAILRNANVSVSHASQLGSSTALPNAPKIPQSFALGKKQTSDDTSAPYLLIKLGTKSVIACNPLFLMTGAFTFSSEKKHVGPGYLHSSGY